MDETEHAKDHGIPLDKLFSKQMDMEDKEEPMEFPVNDEHEIGAVDKVLLIRPHGFKPPPIKIVAANLQNAWQDLKGVQIIPNRYIKDTIVCIFKSKEDFEKVIKGGAWTVRGSHLLMGKWDRSMPMEQVPLDTANFWIQIRGMPSEAISLPPECSKSSLKS